MAKKLLFNQSGGGGGGGLDNGTVLWENPNPNAAFGSQVVTLSQNYSDFEFIGIEYKCFLSDTYTVQTYVNVMGLVEQPSTNLNGALGTKTSAYGCRNFELRNNNTVWFYVYYAAGSTSTSGNAAIPVRIIGY